MKISILGCGWLGLPLAKQFVANGHAVNGSTTSENTLSLLKAIKINPFLISLNENEISGNIIKFLENSEVLIINIPPKLRGDIKENFVSKIKNILTFIEESTVQKVVFVSSTSVYADDNTEITEDTIAKPETEGGKQLFEVERLLQENNNFKTTIVRFGGLIGDNRHPINFLSGKINLENPEGPINLIHQDDCIAIIVSVVKLDIWNQVFNAVSPFHPTRREYYTQKAIENRLELPYFNDTNPSFGKTILSHKLIKWLNYEFKQVLS